MTFSLTLTRWNSALFVARPSDLQIKHRSSYKMPEKPAEKMEIQRVIAIERHSLVSLHWCELTGFRSSHFSLLQAVASFKSSHSKSLVLNGHFNKQSTSWLLLLSSHKKRNVSLSFALTDINQNCIYKTRRLSFVLNIAGSNGTAVAAASFRWRAAGDRLQPPTTQVTNSFALLCGRKSSTIILSVNL